MKKELLQRYATLKIEQKRIENELDFLQPQVMQEVKNISDTDPVQVDEMGVFSIKKLKRWQFSPILMDLKAQVTERELTEKADGTATFEESECLTFREIIK